MVTNRWRGLQEGPRSAEWVMLFLLNTVVVKIPDVVRLPRGLEPLTRMTPAGALKAGGEIYARHPRLEYDRLDIAEWYCGLLMAKHPGATGALGSA